MSSTGSSTGDTHVPDNAGLPPAAELNLEPIVVGVDMGLTYTGMYAEWEVNQERGKMGESAQGREVLRHICLAS
jgi:hypothetical protein